MDEPPCETTEILSQLGRGDASAVDRLLPRVYEELHALAERYFRNERPGLTLQPTALVHEAYLKLVDRSRADYDGRAHFVAVAARAMRQILIDRARRQNAVKHGAALRRVTLDVGALRDAERRDVDLLALDEALRRLAALDDRKSRVVELRFFGGLSIEDTATALGVARSTVTEDWRMARAWIVRELEGVEPA